MKFKVGDKVKHKDFGVGEIIGFDDYDNRYAVEFENEYNDLTHNFLHTYMDAGLSNPIDREAGFWCRDYEIELDKEQSHNLIPQIAKMLGVEIGEEFMLTGVLSDGRSSNTKFRFTNNGVEINDNYWMERPSFLTPILNKKYTIKKLPKKPKLTEDEKVILRNIPEKYKYIARDNSGALYIYKGKPYKEREEWYSVFRFNELNLFQHLFQFIKWEDKEPYKIQELLEEYENLRSK